MAGEDTPGGQRREEHVHLALPAIGPAAPLARAAAVAMGARAGFGRALLGALSLAVDQALVVVLPTTDDGVDLHVALLGDGLSLTIVPRNPHTPPGPEDAERFAALTGDLVAEATLNPATGEIGLRVSGGGT